MNFTFKSLLQYQFLQITFTSLLELDRFLVKHKQDEQAGTELGQAQPKLG